MTQRLAHSSVKTGTGVDPTQISCSLASPLTDLGEYTKVMSQHLSWRSSTVKFSATKRVGGIIMTLLLLTAREDAQILMLGFGAYREL